MNHAIPIWLKCSEMLPLGWKLLQAIMESHLKDRIYADRTSLLSLTRTQRVLFEKMLLLSFWEILMVHSLLIKTLRIG